MIQKHSFDDYMHRIFGDALDKFLQHSPVSDFVRVNTRRASPQQVISALERYGFECETVCGLPDAIRLKSSPYDVTLCLHHFAGWYVKQSLASQIPVRYLDIKPGQNVLDLCAAPGSKTTQIGSLMAGSGCLYANELAGKRMTVLAARMDSSLVSNAVLYNRAAERLPQILPPCFDRILADVPCTGLGDNANLKENRDRYESTRNPAGQYQLQYQILLTGCKLLRVGGRLVYSTCSLNPEENEAVIDTLLRRFPFRAVEMANLPGIVYREGLQAFDGRQFDASLANSRRVTPWENDTQGFYICVLEKTAELPEFMRQIDPCTHRTPTVGMDDPRIAPVLENIERYYGIAPERFARFRFLRPEKHDVVYCLDSSWESVIDGYQRAGLGFAKRRGGIWRLSHSIIQLFGNDISRNVITLTPSQIEEICATGETDTGTLAESPYPVMRTDELGCLASAYDLGGGRIAWKRPCNYKFRSILG